MVSLKVTFDASRSPRRAACALAGIGLVAVAQVALCQAQPQSNTSNPAHSNRATEQAQQSTYASPEAAGEALFQAVQSGNEQAVQAVLGADDQLASSGDAAVDKLDREQFVQKYQQMHRVAGQVDGTAVLYIGAENWPFPVPLVSRGGTWRFDPDAGATEVLFRRIGENETTAIEVCQAFAEAQRRAGAGNGTAQDSEAGSFVSTLLSTPSAADGAGPFHGYHFRVLEKSPHKFAAIAWPGRYRSSGVMTFAVDQRGAVYEKDLGPSGTKAAQKMRAFHADSSWLLVEE
jgi:Protein of unknown function (DUF2950)